jgi:GAF domain-containing protein
MELIDQTGRRLDEASTAEEVQSTVAVAARRLVGADGASFVLRDGDECFYVDEDAVGPLWKGMRFPLEACISGWAMLNRESAAVPDIYVDSRIPIGAYEPTFVKSLAMVPIRASDPIGAIGTYWAEFHIPSEEEVAHIASLADVTARALERVRSVTETA